MGSVSCRKPRVRTILRRPYATPCSTHLRITLPILSTHDYGFPWREVAKSFCGELASTVPENNGLGDSANYRVALMISRQRMEVPWSELLASLVAGTSDLADALKQRLGGRPTFLVP